MIRFLLAFAFAAGIAACDTNMKQEPLATARDTVRDTVYLRSVTADSASFLDATAIPVTLPVLDAFFADSAFAPMLRDSLQLTQQQIDELRSAAREEAAVVGSDTASMEGSGTMGARQHAMERISSIIGRQKTYALGRMVRDRWAGDTTLLGGVTPSTPGAIPQDTRVVVNAPAFRMDLFEDGELVKSYGIAAGYPEFPLPTGMRSAREIIFNPPWTPPDEPWVEGSGRVKVGQRVAPGSRDNPLGILKIPIGMPSLIHGGKSQGQIGTFGSHGCAGLTNDQARDFAMELASASGTELTDKQIAEFGRSRTQSKTVSLARPIPVELRYETIVVQNDGAVHFYADIYDRGTTSLGTLRDALAANGVEFDALPANEQRQLMQALAAMGGDTTATAGVAGSDGSGTGSDSAAAASPTGKVKVTRSVAGPKEKIVRIAALKGKGYPAKKG